MKKDAVVALVAVVLVVAVAFVLASVRPDRPLTPSKPFEGETKAAAIAKKKADPKDPVVMHINGEPVTESEFNSFAAQAPAEQRQFYLSPMGRRMLADELVKLKALEQEGHRIGIDADPSVRSQVEQIVSQIVAGRTLEKLVKEAMEKRLQAEYAKEKASTKTLRHILVAYQGSQVPARNGEPGPPAAQAMQKAQAIAAKIRAGMKFEEVARTDSDDQQTANRGGILGPAKPDQLPQEIAKVVTALKPGQISDPVRTEFGIHIFRIDEPSLAELKPLLEQKLQREVMNETVDRLQKAAKVEYDDKFFPPQPAVPTPPPQQAPKSNG